MIKKFKKHLIALFSLAFLSVSAADLSKVVQKGETADKIAKKLLNSSQRTSFLKWLESSKTNVNLNPKDNIIFHIKDSKLVGISYGPKNKVVYKQIIKQEQYIKNNKLTSAPVVVKNINILKGESVLVAAKREKIPKFVVDGLLKRANEFKNVKEGDNLSLTWSDKLISVSHNKSLDKQKFSDLSKSITIKSGESVLLAAKREKLPSIVLQNIITQESKIKNVKPNDVINFSWSNNIVKIDHLPHSSVKVNSVAIAESAESDERVLTIAKGESVLVAAKKAKLPKFALDQLLARSNEFKNVKAYDTVKISLDSRLKKVNYAKLMPSEKKPSINFNGQKMVVVRIKKDLNKDAMAAGLSDKIVKNIYEIYNENDSAKKILKSGSNIEIIYDSNQLNPISYARLARGDKRFEAIRYNGSSGVKYYDEHGLPYQKGFIRYPLPQYRISSHFSHSRRHPIYGRVRAHTGVDLSAKTGTPIWASGDGKVIYAGYQRGYGRVVKIQHSPTITTLYAHLSRFDPSSKVGKIVKRKQVIGYVGSSGASTGPHLHFEYLINNQPKDPLTVAMPSAKKLGLKEKTIMLANRQKLLAMAKGIDNIR